VPLRVIRHEPNPPSGAKVTIARAVGDLPAGAHAEIVGSWYRYDKVSPTDLFEIECEGRIVTVCRADLR